VNPDSEIQQLLANQGMRKAPDEMLSFIKATAASRLRSRRRIRTSFAAALAACLVMGLLIFPARNIGKEERSAQNAVFINNIFGTFTAAEAQSDSTYPLLVVDDQDFQIIDEPDRDTLEVTLVDF
jgi:hypothetical protein